MKCFAFKICFLAVLVLGFNSSGFAQITSDGTPNSFTKNVKKSAGFTTIPDAPGDWEQVMISQTPGTKPYLFGWPVKVSIDVIDPDNLVYEDDRYVIYQLNILSSEAYSQNIIFDNYYLPDGVQVYLYDPELTIINGAYTSINNKESGLLATSPIPGNQLVVEVNIDKNLAGFRPQLVIGQVSLDMKNAFGYRDKFGSSGDCNIDINCPQGADWQIEKRAVCKYVRGGTWLCTGALINNTANDGKALLLTANHCIGTGLHARTSIFYFKYESAECYGEDGPINFTISSSDLLATTNKLDFALVELSIKPPERYDPYYAGWDRNSNPFVDNVTCIHHPSGDVKKISAAKRRVSTGDFGGGYDKHTHWNISEWDMGTTEPGSSGSPLFNQSHKIIGDLTGGDASCTYNFNDYFQKFWISWDRYPEVDKQLKAWLDPAGLDPQVWNGYDPYGSDKPLANFDVLPVKAKVDKFVRFKDVTSGAPDQWFWTFQDGTPETSEQRNPLVYFNSSGYKQIMMIASNGLGVDTIKQTIWVADEISFELTKARIVSGAKTNLTNTSTSFLPYLNWKTQKEDDLPVDQGGSQDVELSFDVPGLYNVLFEHEIDGQTTSMLHQNMIRVVSEELIFAGTVISPLKAREVIEPLKIGNTGLIPGDNSIGFEAFANAFEKNMDTTVIITGVRTYINSNVAESSDTWLTTVIWDGEWNVLRRDSMLLITSDEPFWVTNWLDPAIGMDSLVYVGFEMPTNHPAGFASGLTITRNDSDPNNSWAYRNGIWKELSQTTGFNSAIGIELETANFYDDYNSQIKVLTSLVGDGVFRLDLNNLVYESCDVTVYTTSGKKLITYLNQFDNQIEVRLSVPVSGVYLLRVELDNLRFTKKIMLIRN